MTLPNYDLNFYTISADVINDGVWSGQSDYALYPYNSAVLDALSQIQTLVDSIRLYSLVIFAVLLIFGLLAIIWINRRV